MLIAVMDSVSAIIHQIEDRLRGANVSVARVCRAAELDRSAWHRWKAGEAMASPKKWAAVRAVLRPIIGDVPELPGERPTQEAA